MSAARMSSSSLLLEQATPKVRQSLLRIRASAMGGQAGWESLVRSEIAAARGPGRDSPLDIVALSLLLAELCWTDRRVGDALTAFNDGVAPARELLAPTGQMVIDHNLATLRLASWDGQAVHDFQKLGERLEATGLDLADSEAALRAEDAAGAGKHRVALPLFWTQLLRSYRSGCWSVFRSASLRLGRECLRLKLPHEAAFHALSAQDSALAIQIAEHLLADRDAAAVRGVVRVASRQGNLRAHFDVATKLVRRVSDLIPDDQLEEVVEWLRPKYRATEPVARDDSAIRDAWECMQALAERLPANLARTVIRDAVGHPTWRAPNPHRNRVRVERSHMIDTVNAASGSLPEEELLHLAEAAVPLADERRENSDYRNALNLICHLAERGGAAARALVAGRLFRDGKQRDLLLAQAAPVLGLASWPEDELRKLHLGAETAIRRQVQLLQDDAQEPKPVLGGTMKFTRPVAGRSVVTTLSGGFALSSLAHCRRAFQPDQVRVLVAAALDLAGERENLLDNRIELIRALLEFVDVMDDNTSDLVFNRLAKIAAEPVEEPTGTPTSEESRSLLASIQFTTGSPSEVKGIALFMVARLEQKRPGRYRKFVIETIEDFLASPDPTLRRYSFAASRMLPKPPEQLALWLLIGTRDSDPRVGISAYAALALSTSLSLNRNHWRLLLYSARMTTQSPVPALRRHAAAALQQLIKGCQTSASRTEAQEILGLYAQDPSAEVRAAARGDT